MATSIPRLWKNNKVNVPASSTKTVDVIPVAKVSHADYFVNFRNDTEDKTKSLKISAHKKPSGAVKDVVYTRFGDQMDVDVTVKNDATNIFLEVKNNETFSVDVSVTRTIL